MYLYNVSIIVEEGLQSEISDLLNQQVDVIKTAGIEAKLLALLNSPHEGYTYCVHTHAEETGAILDFQDKFLAPLQAVTARKYGEKVVYFDSIMQYL